MSKTTENYGTLPARVQAALGYLLHCWRITDQSDAEIKPRPLTAQESQVQACALRVLEMYFSGELDFGDLAPRGENADGEGDAPTVPAQQE